ncbi:hypothetical protein [Sphingobacterium suaedae]|uniref:XRE family transcriptional regulator n=1 Tax=Sphingobacterium suaedae TaxID=1686402 RepID=A0ABW5KAW5_9SPHI
MRIKTIADREGLSITAFETAVGASRGVFTRALNNHTDIQAKWLIHIVEKYPQYSSDWLLKGEGPMLKSTIVQETQVDYVVAEPSERADTVIDALQQVISSQDITIKSQEKTIIALERLLSTQDEKLQSLGKE